LLNFSRPRKAQEGRFQGIAAVDCCHCRAMAMALHARPLLSHCACSFRSLPLLIARWR
jgi:hypothetical protein